MKFAVLSSGSKANCTLIQSGRRRYLIDCGLSLAESERRLCELGIGPETIDAIFLTHEHSDHLRSVAQWSRRYRIPVYANAATAACLTRCHAQEIFVTGQSFNLAELEIWPFKIMHDAAEPVGFCFQNADFRLTQVTDLGIVSQEVVKACCDCDALIVESNHCPELLQTCSYPWVIKERIAGMRGHLSNEQAGFLLRSVASARLRHLVLAHISENSNRVDRALASMQAFLPPGLELNLQAGGVYQSTRLFDLALEESAAQQQTINF